MCNNVGLCTEEVEKLVLPIKYPVITTYTHHAHLLAILGAYEGTGNWVYGNYTQLFCKRNYIDDPWGDFYFPCSYETKPYDLCSWVHVEKLAWGLLNNGDLITDLLIKLIKNKYYISMMIDYYYVKNSSYYQSQHYSHEVLVYGYDCEEKKFYCADFVFQTQKYTMEKIGFDEMEEAFETTNKTKAEFYRSKLLHLISINEGNYLGFSEQNILNGIREYYHSSVPEYWRIYNGENLENLVFGLEVYEAIIEYFRQIMHTKNKFLDSRPLYLLYDHKTMMKKRMEMLMDMGDLEYQEYYSELKEEYAQLEKKMNAILISSIRYNYDYNEKYLLKGIEGLSSVCLREKEILTPLMEKLESVR